MPERYFLLPGNELGVQHPTGRNRTGDNRTFG